jgi:hypothetical protein
MTPQTFMEQFNRAVAERQARLEAMWRMTPAQRVAAMRRGELTLEQCCAWAARHPDQIPMVHGEWEFIAVRMPEYCE